MPAKLSAQEFVAKWRNNTLKERSAAQEHFIDLCRLVGHPTPAEADPSGESFTFEAGAALGPGPSHSDPTPSPSPKRGGGQGWADVWKKGYFAWEYKGKHADLDKAYQQLLQYREALHNPPLLVVCDIETIVIHTNFTNTVKQVTRLSLDDLLTPAGLTTLQNLFYNFDAFRTAQTTEQVTEQAAKEFARLAELLRKYGDDPPRIAHFLIRLLFCLFAEDVGLLPSKLFSQLVSRTRRSPADFKAQLGQLFGAMASGGWFGIEKIVHFDGGLFDDAAVLELDSEGLDLLARVSGLDWSSIEPSIFGTLFERSLDPAKRAQLGAHYTSKEDILLIVEPVLMAPLRRRWEQVKAEAEAKAEAKAKAKDRGQRTRLENELSRLLTGFADDLAQVRILDPACGSGNFLYVALKQLLDLWKEVSFLAGQVGLSFFTPNIGPSPAQLYGIELNPYAHELAQATVWIGYIQWLRDNGFGDPPEPILKPLHNIVQMDAILAYDTEGRPVEPDWPEADVVIGNPPFLGGNKIRQELGDQYIGELFKLYDGRVPALADLVCYWFVRAQEQIENGHLKRAGLLATNSIRGGANRRVLERIKESGDIFMAWSDRPWILEGAAVRVSMVGFDDGTETGRTLNGQPVQQINADLTSAIDLTTLQTLNENTQIAFVGSQKIGPFDISAELAQQMLTAVGNPNGRPNSDVVRPSVNASDIMGKSRQMWIIDFGATMSKEEAAQYEAPFEYVRKHVKPERDTNRDPITKKNWWLHGRPRPALRDAISNLTRYIVTPRVSKHRVFIWLTHQALPDHKLFVFARDDDYFFGVLQSRPHEVWTLHTCSWHGVGNDPVYSGSACFETFPFPWPPGREPKDDPRVEAIAQAARELVEKRDRWLNPPDLTGLEDLSGLKQRTLTNLYNQRPTWLDLAHQKLDRAVFAAYGWPDPSTGSGLSDEEILARLLALNLERAAGVR